MNWLLLVLVLAGGPLPVEFDAGERRLIATLSPLGQPPTDATNQWADDPAAAQLGEALFFDTRLSADGQLACASCHVPALGFSDGRALAQGSRQLSRHTLSLWNVAWQPWLFWDGRADSLWSQALIPIQHPDEMALEPQALLRLLHRDDRFRQSYEAVFGLLPTAASATAGQTNRVLANTGKALAAFERRLVTPPSPFDQFASALKSGRSANAISPAAQRGLKLFIGRARCILCHSGPTFSDGQFHNTLVVQAAHDAGRRAALAPLLADPFNAAGRFSDAAQGWRAARLQHLDAQSSTQARFRTPGLRNVALTAPYMHGGQYATLAEVVEHYSALHGATGHDHGMAGLLVPLHLSHIEKSALVAFLDSLTSAPATGWLQTVMGRVAQ